MVGRSTLFAFAVVCCLLAQMSLAFEYRLPQAVVDYMATKKMRNHHFVWHNVRDMWNLLNQEDQEKIRALGWAPPRPSQRFGPNGESIVLEDNGSGEDFLYMHRNMIKKANEIAKSICPEARVVGFASIPAPGDPKFPVPPVYDVPGEDFVATDQGVKECKTDDFYWNTLKPQEDKFNDPDYLRSLDLGQFGARIEFTVHNWLHFRYSSNSKLGFRPQPTDVPVPHIEDKWDDPKYNWLADFYSAHVNRLFWKIHGWVDHKIEQWREAHGLKEVPWREDIWETGMEENIPGLENIGEDDDGHEHRLLMGNSDTLQKVIEILVASGHCKSFYQSAKFESEI